MSPFLLFKTAFTMLLLFVFFETGLNWDAFTAVLDLDQDLSQECWSFNFQADYFQVNTLMPKNATVLGKKSVVNQTAHPLVQWTQSFKSLKLLLEMGMLIPTWTQIYKKPSED